MSGIAQRSHFGSYGGFVEGKVKTDYRLNTDLKKIIFFMKIYSSAFFLLFFICKKLVNYPVQRQLLLAFCRAKWAGETLMKIGIRKCEKIAFFLKKTHKSQKNLLYLIQVNKLMD